MTVSIDSITNNSTINDNNGLLDSSSSDNVIAAALLVERAKDLLRQATNTTTTTTPNNATSNGSTTGSRSQHVVKAESIWSVLHQTILTPEIPFEIHRLCYDMVYSSDHLPQLKPCWLPPPKSSSSSSITNIERMMQQQGFVTYHELYEWSIRTNNNAKTQQHHENEFWMSSADAVHIQWSTRPERAFSSTAQDDDHHHDDHHYDYYAPLYFPGGTLNIADSCFRNAHAQNDNDTKPSEAAAILFANEANPTVLQAWTNTELRTLSYKVAHQIQHVLQLPKGTKIAICMPMIPESIAIYLGIILSGCVVVSIADSFSVMEIATRCRIANVKAAFTQDVVYRHDRAIPLADRFWQATVELNNPTNSCSSSYTDTGTSQTETADEKESKTDMDEPHGGTFDSTTGSNMKVVVIPALLHMGDYDDQGKDTTTLHETIQLRPELDWSWNDFLLQDSMTTTPVFDETTAESIQCSSMDPCNILFSSGTTGEPKAVVWSHSTPIKCCIDGYYHQDITHEDRVAWPTNIGWMMGPWLLFQRIHGATICLFQGLPHTKQFCQFIEASKVTMLGVIPSLVKAWYDRGSIDGVDWSRIRRFSSTGEASDEYTYHWLMSRVPGRPYYFHNSFRGHVFIHHISYISFQFDCTNKGYAPVIEYCGGTEIGGSFLSSTMVQPNIPSMFSTPVLGSKISLLDPDTNQVLSTSEFTPGPSGSTAGELVLHPPSVGLSTVLLNRNHFDCYFAGMPKDADGRLLRRHGDAIEAVRDINESLPYYRALGRCDDTMNLGGIKVSSVEIERVCNTVSLVQETAAIAVTAGGPSKLIVYVVLNHSGDANIPSKSDLKVMMQRAIKEGLNPLFGIYDIVVTEALPRTASNKIMRRLLRDEYLVSTTSLA